MEAAHHVAMRRHGLRLAVAVPVLLVCACGSVAGPVVGSQPAVSISRGAGGGTAVAAPGGGAVTTAGAASRGGDGASAPASLSGPPASGAAATLTAAPGRYTVHVTSSQQVNGAPNGSSRDEADPLVVSAAVEQDGGAAQRDTVTAADGRQFVFDLVYRADGSVLLLGATQPGAPGFEPSPPVMIVPATGSAGSWSSSFTGPGGASGTWNASLSGPGSATIGGQSVATEMITATATYSGTFQGIPYTATIRVSAQWAPSLHLFAGYRSAATGHTAGATPFTATMNLAATLLTPRPS